MKEQIVIVCGTYNSETDPEPTLPGISAPCCGGCDKTVWICDCTIQRIKDTIPGINLEERIPTPLCHPCTARLTADAKSIKVVMPTIENIMKIMNRVK